MKKIFILFSLMLTTQYATVFAHAGITTTLDSLKQEFSETYTEAPKKGGELSTSAYRMAYAFGSSNPKGNLGKILYAIDLQDAAINELYEHNSQQDDPFFSAKVGSDFKTSLALMFVQLGITFDCHSCKTLKDKIEFSKAVQFFMDFYDIEQAGKYSPRSKKNFSGLPFFDFVMNKFNDELFQKETIKFYTTLEETIVTLHSSKNIETNVLDIALQATNNNYERAIELASILISRDSNVIKYFDYYATKNKQFIKAVSQSPLLIRLIVEMDRVYSGSKYDRFSYDGKTTELDVRNYYYWSAALTSLVMHRKGFRDEHIKELNLQFPRFYKILRYIEVIINKSKNFIKTFKLTSINNQAFWKDTIMVMKISGDGSRAILAHQNQTNAVRCDGLF